MHFKINKESLGRLPEVIKTFARSKYGLLSLLSFLTLSMGGFIIVQSMTKKTPPPVAYTRNFSTPLPTQPVIISPTSEDLSPMQTQQVSDVNMPTSTSTPIPTPTPTADPTTNWLIYINTQYGYTVKYPTDWVVQNISPLEPKVPSYLVFNDKTASVSSRSITISVSNRTYAEQLVIGGAGSPVIIAGLIGTQEYLKDSNGNESVTIVLPRTSDLILLHSKLIYTTIFNEMLSTFRLTN